MDVSPLAIYFVKNGSNGDKMLFKYPFAEDIDHNITTKNTKRNPYSLGSDGSPISLKITTGDSEVQPGKLTQFLDDDLSYLLAVNKKLCGTKFELKVNDIRFVGHPVNLEDYKGNYPTERDNQRSPEGSSILLFNIVFALKVGVSHGIVSCYHDLSRRLGIALSFEEQRCNFLSREAKIMLAELDEQSQQPEATRKQNAFQIILSKSLIAKHLKKVYQDLGNFGKIHLRLNNWIDISFCLPQKINLGLGSSKRITHKNLMKGLEKVKPYHTMLLLVDRQELLKTMSADVSPALRRILHVESPINPFYTLAADADLTIPHVLLLVGHLIYWGFATIIYPVCNTNIYVLASHVPTGRMSKLGEKFNEEFPGFSYHQTLAEYSLPISLRDKCTPMSLPQEQQQENKKLLWMLKHGLLQQLHTYVYILPQSSPKLKTMSFSSVHSSARGLLATVAEAIAEKPSDESFLSFRADMEWHDESKLVNEVIEKSPPSKTRAKEIAEGDQNGDADYTWSALLQRKVSAEGLAVPQSLSSQKNLPQAVLSQSLTPSESEFGSVCSDDRSASPGCGTPQITEEGILKELDKWLSSSEKEMVLNTDAAKNFEDLKLFSNLCQYFRGEHPLEEIMYRANIHRSQLLEILDKFRVVLITVQRIDPSISFCADA